MIKLKNNILLLVFLPILIILSILSLRIGPVNLSTADIWDVLSNHALSNPTYQYIVESRLNRTLVALLAGAGLSIAGLVLQVFFRNPLAGPGVLGISSGASLGVAVVLLGGLTLQNMSGYTLTLTAGFIGAIGILLLLLLMSKYVHQMVTLLVIGLMMSYFSSAILNVLYQWADKESTRDFVLWGLGSFEGLSSNDLNVFAIVISISLILTFALVKPLNALSLGIDYARSFGIDIKAVRIQIILITGILTAVVTVFCGPIGFLGMAVPQLSRQLSKSQNYLFIMPLTIILGAILALVSDIFVRLFDEGIPLNTATSLIGAPIIIWVIFRLNKRPF